jgi:diguanylate cyclase (GGDEF)-like protein
MGGWGLSVLFCDIDHFKDLNDEFWHAAGDEVLRKVAAIVGHSTRRRDLEARYGGDEFVLTVANGGTEQAIEGAERLRSTVEAAHIHPGVRPQTISVGIATLPRDVQSKEELIDAADRAMYAAKQRSQLVSACP